MTLLSNWRKKKGLKRNDCGRKFNKKKKKVDSLLSEISWKKNDHVIGFLSSRFQVRKKMNMHLEDKVATSNKIEIIQSITHSNNIFSRLRSSLGTIISNFLVRWVHRQMHEIC